MRLFSIAIATAALLASTATAKVTEKMAESYPLNADGTISLSNINGSVEIVGWDRNEVDFEAEKSARNEDALKHIRIEVRHTPERLVIKTEHEKTWKLWNSSNAQVAYKLKVPAGATLKKIDVVNASIRVSGVRGPIDLESVNGSIKALGMTAGGSFETVNGSITATFASLSAGDKVSLETVNGSCTLLLPADTAFDLDADTVNGRISCDFPVTIRKSGRGALKGSVNGGGAKVSLESVNGSLNVKQIE